METDFGTYHHSTPEESRDMRDKVEKAFSLLLPSLYPPDAELKILDAGCGLGFLTTVAARCFPRSGITGVDIFQHDSLSEASRDKALSNMKAMGLDARVELLQHDLRKPLGEAVEFDLAVSSLVFHNLGKERFHAYGTVFSALKPGGYFVIGDLFPGLKQDLAYFNEMCETVEEEGTGESGEWAYRIFTLKTR